MRIDRRRALAAFGTVSLGGLLAACGSGGDDDTTTPGATPTAEAPGASSPSFDDSATCRLTAEAGEGPFYFDVDSVRSDIRDDREGTLLHLAIRVRDAERCEPVADAVVDIWHCDAGGEYSVAEDPFLRGVQVTDAEGVARFKTIYPGWYPGRTTHIHAKVHLDKTAVLTTQLFTNAEFDEKVYASEPYDARPDRDVFNDDDGIYFKELEMTLSEEGDGVLGRMTLDVARA